MASRPLVVMLRYHEVVLKGLNRPVFEGRIEKHVRRVLAGLPIGPLQRASARLLIPVTDAAAWPAVRERLGRVFGVANFAPAVDVAMAEDGARETVLAPLGTVALELLEGREVPSFRVLTKRSDKSFPIPSPEVSAVIGARVKEATGARVDLDHGAVTVAIDVLRHRALVSVDKCEGAGGLPVGSSGKVLVLLSGGIDSPVAAWRIMRRGCYADFVHFHSAPFVDRTSQQKARALAERLVAWEGSGTLWLVPFFEVQRQIIATAARPFRVVLYRRMMLRIAEALAPEARAEALVTGDSLGQVASQTLANLAVIGEVATRPILRPLLAMDKNEIMAEAARIGTYETSIIPDQDCCSLFAPAHPTTRASPHAVQEAEARIDVAGLVQLALAGAERIRMHYPPKPDAA